MNSKELAIEQFNCTKRAYAEKHYMTLDQLKSSVEYHTHEIEQHLIRLEQLKDTKKRYEQRIRNYDEDVKRRVQKNNDYLAALALLQHAVIPSQEHTTKAMNAWCRSITKTPKIAMTSWWTQPIYEIESWGTGVSCYYLYFFLDGDHAMQFKLKYG